MEDYEYDVPEHHTSSHSSHRDTPDSLSEQAHKWRRIPGVYILESMLRFFSPSERLLLYGLSVILALSTLLILVDLNREISVTVPQNGGSLSEGIVGTPRFINPLLALSDADRDLVALVYSGLMRAHPDGALIPDLAERFEISEDGLTYTFMLREDAVFHDGTPITATDIAFTVQAAQNPDIKSPKRADWDGVEVQVMDERTLLFILPRPYAPFLENTTLGVLPESLWGTIEPSEFPFTPLNTNPVGSGPYEVSAIRTDSSGTPTRYTLKSFKHFALGAPHLNTIELSFFANNDALIDAFNAGDAESIAGFSPTRLDDLETDESAVHTTTLPRVFAVFLNQNQSGIFAEEEVREALDAALDKQAVIDTVLAGYGSTLDGPIPPNVLLHQSRVNEEDESATQAERTERARTILDNGGWEFDEEEQVWKDDEARLSFVLTTADTPELVTSAETIAAMWRDAGIGVTVEVFGPTDLNTSIIRPREYQALLFGEVVGRTLDLFAFWHSSQRSDPGLNLALYTNSTADTLLSDARVESDRKIREEKFVAFSDIVKEDMPAIFLYAPDFMYVTPSELKSVSLGALTTPAERFLNVHEWHVETESVWSIFENK